MVSPTSANHYEVAQMVLNIIQEAPTFSLVLAYIHIHTPTMFACCGIYFYGTIIFIFSLFGQCSLLFSSFVGVAVIFKHVTYPFTCCCRVIFKQSWKDYQPWKEVLLVFILIKLQGCRNSWNLFKPRYFASAWNRFTCNTYIKLRFLKLVAILSICSNLLYRQPSLSLLQMNL